MQDVNTMILMVEDEVVIADYLQAELETIGYKVGGVATDYISAIEMIKKCRFDLILLDIELGGEKTGLDVARYLNDNDDHFPFIYLTSYSDPVTVSLAKATRPAAYLTKPFTPAGIFSAIEIVLYNRNVKTNTELITIAEGRIEVKLKQSDILYIEAEHVYSTIVTKERRILVRSSLSAILSSLPSDGFLRVHRSYIVNIGHISVFQPCHITVGDHKIPVGRTFRDTIATLRR